MSREPAQNNHSNQSQPHTAINNNHDNEEHDNEEYDDDIGIVLDQVDVNILNSMEVTRVRDRPPTPRTNNNAAAVNALNQSQFLVFKQRRAGFSFRDQPPRDDGEDPDIDAVHVQFNTPENIARWRRPSVYWRTQYFDKGQVMFQANEVDFFSVGGEIRMCLYGVTDQGHSICCKVGGFEPYLYVECPPTLVSRSQCSTLKDVINEIASRQRWNRGGATFVDIVDRTSVMGHQFGETQRFLRIAVQTTNLVNQIRSWFEAGEVPLPYDANATNRQSWRRGTPLLTYESNVPFALRFMIDTGMAGCSWVSIPMHEEAIEGYAIEPSALPPSPSASHRQRHFHHATGHNPALGSIDPTDRVSRAQIEIDVSDYRHMKTYESKDEHAGIGRVRVCCFDIECASFDGRFPDPEVAPVIQISNYVFEFGGGGNNNNGDDNQPQAKSKQRSDDDVAGLIEHNVFVLGSCAAMSEGINAYSFEDEATLLLAWRDFIQELDPDVITGYNIAGFDVPYLLKRAIHLGIDGEFSELGRELDKKTVIHKSVFESKARGRRESFRCDIPGRTQIDMQDVIRIEHKLPSYTLNSVSAKFLKNQKMDVHHSQITPLFLKNARTRRTLAEYCAKDAALPAQIMEKLMTIPNFVQMARVTGVPLSYVIGKGQQVKVYSQLLRTARGQDMIVPTPPNDRNTDLYRNMYHIYIHPSVASTSETDLSNVDSTCKEARRGPTLKQQSMFSYSTNADGSAASIPKQTGKSNAREREIGYTGATVIEPKTGYYDAPIITLDFAGLYPSIMIANNLCYTTLLASARAVAKCVAKYGKDSYIITPEGYCFVHRKHAMGMLPDILVNLLKARKEARKHQGVAHERSIVARTKMEWIQEHIDEPNMTEEQLGAKLQEIQDHHAFEMKECKGNKGMERDIEKKIKRVNDNFAVREEYRNSNVDELKRLLHETAKMRRADEMESAVYNGMQLAIKVSANSVYGFTGALKAGVIPRLEISSSVTSVGRTMIERVKSFVESTYTIANGHPYDAIVVYGDTDSVFIWLRVPNQAAISPDDAKANERQIIEAMTMGAAAAEAATKLFESPIMLEFEKVYRPLLLLAKKRYAGLKYMGDPSRHLGVDATGIEIARRDGCRLMRDTMKRMIQMLMVERNKNGAIEYVKQRVADLKAGRVDFTDLVISKSMSRNPLDYAVKSPHTELAVRLALREAATAPNCGDRVPYVITTMAQRVIYAEPLKIRPLETDDSSSTQQREKGDDNDDENDYRPRPLRVEPMMPRDSNAFHRSEDPLYALKNNVPIDVDYYVRAQMKLPLTRILAPMLGGEAAVHKMIFEGDHMRVRNIQYVTNNTGIMQFAHKVQGSNCIACKRLIKASTFAPLPPMAENANSTVTKKKKVVKRTKRSKKDAEPNKKKRQKTSQAKGSNGRKKNKVDASQPSISLFFAKPPAQPVASPPPSPPNDDSATMNDTPPIIETIETISPPMQVDEAPSLRYKGLCVDCQDRYEEILAHETDVHRKLITKQVDLKEQCRKCQGEELYGFVDCTNRDCDIFYAHAKVEKDISVVSERIALLSLNTDSSSNNNTQTLDW